MCMYCLVEVSTQWQAGASTRRPRLMTRLEETMGLEQKTVDEVVTSALKGSFNIPEFQRGCFWRSDRALLPRHGERDVATWCFPDNLRVVC